MFDIRLSSDLSLNPAVTKAPIYGGEVTTVRTSLQDAARCTVRALHFLSMSIILRNAGRSTTRAAYAFITGVSFSIFAMSMKCTPPPSMIPTLKNRRPKSIFAMRDVCSAPPRPHPPVPNPWRRIHA